MNANLLNNIEDPKMRADAMRAQAVADTIAGAVGGIHNLVKAVTAKVSAHLEYRRTFALLASMTDRELDDIGISRGDIRAVARGLDPRPQALRRPGDALARRLAVAEAFEQGQTAGEPAGHRANDNRPAAAA